MKFDKTFAGGFESYTITLQLGIYNSLHRLETLLQGACIVMFNKNRFIIIVKDWLLRPELKL